MNRRGFLTRAGAAAGALAALPFVSLLTSASKESVASFGQLWVKNDHPNVLMYTDNNGIDTEINVDVGGVATIRKVGPDEWVIYGTGIES